MGQLQMVQHRKEQYQGNTAETNHRKQDKESKTIYKAQKRK